MPPTGTPTVLFVGRNEKRKGLNVLLDAFGEVASAVPGSRLVVIGEGYGPGAVQAAGGARGDVTWLGFVGNDELASYYSAADVFCSPALGGESFGIVLIEAMASGTPVVASDIPGYRDVLDRTLAAAFFSRPAIPGLVTRSSECSATGTRARVTREPASTLRRCSPGRSSPTGLRSCGVRSEIECWGQV